MCVCVCVYVCMSAQVIYHDVVMTTKKYMIDVSVIQPLWLSELAYDCCSLSLCVYTDIYLHTRTHI